MFRFCTTFWLLIIKPHIFVNHGNQLLNLANLWLVCIVDHLKYYGLSCSVLGVCINYSART